MKCEELKSFIVLYDGKFERVYAEKKVDAAIAELKDENERLKRALWLARANRAMAESYSVFNDVPTSNKWVKALNKLNAKAEGLV